MLFSFQHLQKQRTNATVWVLRYIHLCMCRFIDTQAFDAKSQVSLKSLEAIQSHYVK